MVEINSSVRKSALDVVIDALKSGNSDDLRQAILNHYKSYMKGQ